MRDRLKEFMDDDINTGMLILALAAWVALATGGCVVGCVSSSADATEIRMLRGQMEAGNG